MTQLSRRHGSRGLVLASILQLLVSGCASIQGYPTDPERTKVILFMVRGSFDGTEEKKYYQLDIGDQKRTTLRNLIIAMRIRGYDVTFSEFERQLVGTSNSVSLGSDLVGLALGGLTATVGGAGTKAALGAASAGVLGGSAAIDKDLFYQKTIPALISQMEANRAKALLPILKGRVSPDDKYPLSSAIATLTCIVMPAAFRALSAASLKRRQPTTKLRRLPSTSFGPQGQKRRYPSSTPSQQS